jgi:hypothetical protein
MIATPAGFEPELEPSLSADLQKDVERLRVPLGSGEITWRGPKSVCFGPGLAPEGWKVPAGFPTRWGRLADSRAAGPVIRLQHAGWGEGIPKTLWLVVGGDNACHQAVVRRARLHQLERAENGLQASLRLRPLWTIGRPAWTVAALSSLHAPLAGVASGRIATLRSEYPQAGPQAHPALNFLAAGRRPVPRADGQDRLPRAPMRLRMMSRPGRMSCSTATSDSAEVSSPRAYGCVHQTNTVAAVRASNIFEVAQAVGAFRKAANSSIARASIRSVWRRDTEVSR